MAITLKNLIQIAPFPEDQRKVLLSNFDKISEDEKYELSAAAWEGLGVMFAGRLEVGKQQIMDEAIKNKKNVNQNDFTELEARIVNDFAQKLQSAETEEQIAEVKKQLETYKTKPLIQDKVTPVPENPTPVKQ